MMLIYSICLPAILGYLAVSLFLKGRSTSTLEMISLSYPFGIGLMSLLMFFLGLCRVPLTFSTVSLSALTGIIFMAVWKYKNRCSSGTGSEPAADNNASAKKPIIFVCELFLAAWIFIKLGSIFLQTFLKPISLFDSYTNWSVRAKAFYFANSLLLDPSRSDFFGKGIIHSTGNYPVLDPLAQVWTAQCLGSFDEVLVKFWTALFLLSAVVYLYKIAAKETSRLLSLVVVVIFVSSPLVSLHATEAQADFPLAIYILFALTSLLYASRGRSEYLPMIGLFSVFAMFTKVEGVLFSAPLFLVAGMVIRNLVKDKVFSAGSAFCRLCFPYLLIMPWFLFKQYYKLGAGTDECVFSFNYNPQVIVEYLTSILYLQNFNVVFAFIPLAALSYRRLDRELLLMIFPVLSYAGCFLSIYIFIGYYNDINLRYSHSMIRNSLTFYPASCLIMVLLINRLVCKKPFKDQPPSSDIS